MPLLRRLLDRNHRLRRRAPRPLSSSASSPGYSFEVPRGLQGIVVECSDSRGVVLSHVPPSLSLAGASVGDQVTRLNDVDLTPMSRVQAVEHLRRTVKQARVFHCRAQGV